MIAPRRPFFKEEPVQGVGGMGKTCGKLDGATSSAAHLVFPGSDAKRDTPPEHAVPVIDRRARSDVTP